jgi:hypothetical protein
MAVKLFRKRDLSLKKYLTPSINLLLWSSMKTPTTRSYEKNNVLLANVRSAITILRNSVNVGNPLSDSQREWIYTMAVDELAPLHWHGKDE